LGDKLAITVNKIKNYMGNELNIIISGHAGTGKTSILLAAAKELGWNLKYYSAATIDPYTDLVGLPVPNHELKTVEYFRPKEIDNADVVFFDEANRADPKTLNTLFELIQFGSINGEKLPKLKCVVAAINPNDGTYNVDDLDPALLDRFDVYLQSEASIDFGYFRKKFGDRMASEVMDFWSSYHKDYKSNKSSSRNKMVYISPRRMEKIVEAFIKIPNKSTIVDSLPPGAITGIDNLYRRLREALNDPLASPAAESKDSEISKLLGLNSSELRSVKNAAKIKKAIQGDEINPEASRLLNQLSAALNQSVGAERATKNWGYAISKMTPTQVKTMTLGWDIYKMRDLRDSMTKANLNLPSLRSV
jgi:hypothetical protein